MKIISYKNLLKELVILKESIPWRNGKVPIDIGETSMEGLKQKCIVLNNLSYFHLKPSFMIIFPSLDPLKEIGGGTNGFIIASPEAQYLEYRKIESGLCYAKTYFWGRPKRDRFLDLLDRLSERGFSLENFSNLKSFDKDVKLNLSVDRNQLLITLGGFRENPELKDKNIIKINTRISRIR